jgi:hypothetical protein
MGIENIEASARYIVDVVYDEDLHRDDYSLYLACTIWAFKRLRKSISREVAYDSIVRKLWEYEATPVESIVGVLGLIAGIFAKKYIKELAASGPDDIS